MMWKMAALKSFSSMLFFSLAVLFLGEAAAGTNASGAGEITSIACDTVLYDSGYEGYCLLVYNAGEDTDVFRFGSEADVELLGGGRILQQGDGGYVVSGLGLERGAAAELVLKFSGNVSNHRAEMLPFTFPCKVERAMVAAHAQRSKLVWDTGFPAYSLMESENVLAQQGVTDEDIAITDADYVKLRKMLSKDPALPVNRIYVHDLQAESKAAVYGLLGGGFDQVLPYAATAVLICILLLLGFYLLSGRPMILGGHESEAVTQEPEEPWTEERKRFCEEMLGKLAGDEHILYKAVYDRGGSALQRNLPEETGFSKAKVTRVLDRLEQRGLIERMSYGVTNNVVLKCQTR